MFRCFLKAFLELVFSLNYALAVHSTLGDIDCFSFALLEHPILWVFTLGDTNSFKVELTPWSRVVYSINKTRGQGVEKEVSACEARA